MAGPIQSEINNILTTTAGGIAAGKQLYEQNLQKKAAEQTAENIAEQTKQQAQMEEFNRREAIMKNMESENFGKDMDTMFTDSLMTRDFSTLEDREWFESMMNMYNKSLNPARQTELAYLQGKVKYEDVIKAKEDLYKERAYDWSTDANFIGKMYQENYDAYRQSLRDEVNKMLVDMNRGNKPSGVNASRKNIRGKK